VAQYGLLARFNNYDEFFQRFERHNAQIGVSLQLPIFTGPGISAQVAQTSTELSRLKIEYANLRNRIGSDLDAGFRDVRRAGSAADLARLDLEVAREQLSLALARMEEGRAPLREVEEARVVENEKWISFYDARYALEKARLNLLRLVGTLEASLQ
jgi:outer membrane protein TolC